MKVLFINTVYGNGSTGRIVRDIGNLLEESGHQYKAIYGRGKREKDQHVYYLGKKYSSILHALLTRFTDKCGFFSVVGTKKAISYIEEYKPDIIHLHNLHGYYINIKILFDYLKTKYKGKVVWTLHDCWAFTGHCTHYTYVKCDKWKTQCFNCPEKKRYPSSLFIDASKKNYLIKKELFTGLSNMVIVTPSAWLKKEVEKSFLKNYKCIVINNGVDLDVFKPITNYNEEANKIILNVADGIDIRKGYKDLIRLSEKLPRNYQVMLVGVHKKDIYKIPPNIVAICKTNSIQELVKYYNKAQFLINTTYEDTFPTVNIESLACGTPVITYNSGGSSEIVDEQSGEIVNPGDIDKILKIINEKSFDEKKCRTRAEEFDKKNKYMDYLKLYFSLIEEKEK